MGGSASKELNDTDLGSCTVHKDNTTAIFAGAVTKDALENIKGEELSKDYCSRQVVLA